MTFQNVLQFYFTDEKGKYTKSAKGLLINKVTKADSGDYTCKAFQVSPSISNVKELPIKLSVQRELLYYYQTLFRQ